MNRDVQFALSSTPAFLHSEGEMGRRIADFAWDGHPLGPLDAWPQSLRTAVSLILNSRHPMWIGWGPEMWFLYNDAYLHVLGLSKHPWALGRPAEEVWAEIWDVCGPLADKVFRYGEASFVDDVRLFMSRGEYLEETFYSFSYSPIRDESGHVAGLFCPSNDVTPKVVGARRLRTLSELAANALAQKSADAACASAAATLARNADDVPFAAIYLADGDRCVLQQTAGVNGDDDFQAPLSIPRSGAQRGISQAIVNALQSGRTQRFSFRNADDPPRGAADRAIINVLVLPVASRADSHALGVLVAGVNPTRPLDDEHATFFELVASNIGTAIQNARASEEEKKRSEMLAEMDRAKTAFFTNVSHEFRTPLTLMLGPLDEISKSTDQRDRLLAQTARRNALRLLKLVNTLLEFSRLEAGRNDAAFVPTDLAALTRDVASSFRSAIESTGLRFVVDADLDEFVFVDRSMWERILLNLLSNALKFTFEGQISVRLQRFGDLAELSVSDTGVGILPEYLPNLFERFHRVRGSKSRSHEGSGIGLALVRDLTAVHGGSVDVESVAGGGTTLRVRIPFGSEHLDASRITLEGKTPFASAVEQYLAEVDATVVRAATTFSGAVSTGRPRVLFADDNPDLREYVRDILSSHYDVVTVNNGRDALSAAQAESFDLILSDVMMPEMDGFELLRAVRADERLAATPFIILSARAGEESAVEGLLRGADEYIPKPFSSEELLARVYAQINTAAIRERATRELRASEERFRTLAASLPYIVFEADANGAVTFLSDAYTAYTGLSPESGYESGWTDSLHPDDVESAGQWLTALSGGEPHVAEFRLRRQDGVYRWFVGRALPQRDANGAIYRWTGTVVDVHDQRKAASERDLLARASEILAQPFDLETTLRAIAAFTIPEIADWCQIDLRTEEGLIRTVAIAHRDPEKDRIAQRLVGRVHLNPQGDHGSPYVIRTGKSQLLQHVPDDIVFPAVGDADEVGLYRDLGMHSALAVPLQAEGKTLGMLGVLHGSSRRRFSSDDVPMLEELGRRAGLAIQRAGVFEREHRAAESFQEASLPKNLPSVPGLMLDAFYASGRAEAQVGGDWYDALRLVDGRVVLSIGDVAGSGLDAAVTMGNMRQIIRGIAQVHADPALMLDAADRALRLEHPDTFVTAFVGVFDSITKSFTYASAGHPPPLLRRPDGEVDALRDTGLPLGLRANGGANRSKGIEILEGSSLVFYTDGLTEYDRAPAHGEARLCEIVGDAALCKEPHPAKQIVERMTDETAARDDVAVLFVNFGSTPDTGSDAEGLLQRWSFHSDDGFAAGAARAAFAGSFACHGGSSEDVALAELVFGELVSNTVRYASGHVETIVDWSGPEPVLHVLDNGPGFRHLSILPPDVLSESGRGLFIVSALTHDFRVSKRASGGSHARAVLRLRSRQLVDARVDILSGSLLNALDGSITGFDS